MWSHARLVADVTSMKVFVWALAQLFPWAVDSNGGVLDSHLYFYARYSELAEHHRLRGRKVRAGRLQALAEGHYRAAPDDDDGPEAVAMAMPVPRAPIITNAVSTMRVPRHGRTTHRAPPPSPAR